MLTTRKRPPLTRTKARQLVTLAERAEALAGALLATGTDDQRGRANDMLEACEWLRALAAWKLDPHGLQVR